jgi:hypothetical protein
VIVVRGRTWRAIAQDLLSCLLHCVVGAIKVTALGGYWPPRGLAREQVTRPGFPLERWMDFLGASPYHPGIRTRIHLTP